MIHDVITTPNPFPYTTNFMFDGVRNDKKSTNETLKDKYNTYRVLSYIKNILLGWEK